MLPDGSGLDVCKQILLEQNTLTLVISANATLKDI